MTAEGKSTGLWSGLRENFNSANLRRPDQGRIDRIVFIEGDTETRRLRRDVLILTGGTPTAVHHGHDSRLDRGVHQFIVGYEGGRRFVVARNSRRSTARGSTRRPSARG